MSYQGPPPWKVPPSGGWPQQQQPQQQWQPAPPPQPGPPRIPDGSIGCRSCGYVAPPRLMQHGGAGVSGCLAVALLFCGVVPGVLYLIFGGSSGSEYAYCQRCNALHGRWSGSNAGWIVAGVFFGTIAVALVVMRALS